MTARTGWLWGTRRSLALKVGGIALVALVSVGGAALGVRNAPRVAEGEGGTAAIEQAAVRLGRGLGVIAYVLEAQDGRLTVRTRQGREGTIVTGPRTIVRRSGERVTAADIRAGDQIVAVGLLRPRARPPVMDARLIIIRPARGILNDDISEDGLFVGAWPLTMRSAATRSPGSP